MLSLTSAFEIENNFLMMNNNSLPENNQFNSINVTNF